MHINPNLNKRKKKKNKIVVAFDRPKLVNTRFSADKRFLSMKINNPVIADAIRDREFLDDNTRFFFKQEGITLDLQLFVQDGTNEDLMYLVNIYPYLEISVKSSIPKLLNLMTNFLMINRR